MSQQQGGNMAHVQCSNCGSYKIDTSETKTFYVNKKTGERKSNEELYLRLAPAFLILAIGIALSFTPLWVFSVILAFISVGWFFFYLGWLFTKFNPMWLHRFRCITCNFRWDAEVTRQEELDLRRSS